MADNATHVASSSRRQKPADKERRGLFARLGLRWRQTVAELRKVVWPTRTELVTYSVVAVVFITFMVTLVGLLDVGFANLVLHVFG